MKWEAIIRLFYEWFDYEIARASIMVGDNEKCIQGINSDATMEGVRHARIRVSYMREKVISGDVIIKYVSGKTLAVDGLTKVVDMHGQSRLREYVLGNGRDNQVLNACIQNLADKDDNNEEE
jgi:hypothetical protein